MCSATASSQAPRLAPKWPPISPIVSMTSPYLLGEALELVVGQPGEVRGGVDRAAGTAASSSLMISRADEVRYPLEVVGIAGGLGKRLAGLDVEAAATTRPPSSKRLT